MKATEVHVLQAETDLERLMMAVRSTRTWRERVLLSHGASPPTAYHRILLYLFLHELHGGEPMSLTVLGRYTGISHQSISNIVKRMSFDGVVDLHHDAEDRRSKKVSLTSDGTEMAIA
jgi:DNA-binding MarR family transcriptional regulator